MDDDLERLRKAASEADRGEGHSLRGLSRLARRTVMTGGDLDRLSALADSGGVGVDLSKMSDDEILARLLGRK